MTDFIEVACLDQLREGQLLPLEVEGELVCLTKVEGVIYAFNDNCTHISGPLNDGELEGHVLTCPWHLARFDVRTGQVLRGPARQELLTYPVRVEGDTISIQLPPEEP